MLKLNPRKMKKKKKFCIGIKKVAFRHAKNIPVCLYPCVHLPFVRNFPLCKIFITLEIMIQSFYKVG